MEYREPPHTRLLRRWFQQLTHSIDVREVIGSLMSASCVTMRDYERIARKCDSEGQTVASEILISEVLLRNPDPECFRHLMNALESSGREYIAAVMKKEYQEALDYEINMVAEDRTNREAAGSGYQHEFNQEEEPEYNDYQDTAGYYEEQPQQEEEGMAEPSGHVEVRPHREQGVCPPKKDAGEQREDTEEQEMESTSGDQYPVVQQAGTRQARILTEPMAGQVEQGDDPRVEYPPDDQYLPHAVRNVSVPEKKKEELGIQLETQIGRGSYGIVYQGNINGTPVAVKAIVLTIAKRTKKKPRKDLYKEQIGQEFQVSAYVRHTNVALLMAYALEKNLVYLVYEFIDGHNMEQVIFDDDIRESYQLNKKEKFCLIIQLVQALAYLHQCNPKVIHGDLKPSNMMVKQDKTVAKLCDLGLSKLKERNAATTTGGNLAPGTPMYMAREQLLERKSSTTRTDVWSMGASMYEVFFEEEVWEDEGEALELKEITKMLERNQMPTRIQNPGEADHDVAELIASCFRVADSERPTALKLLKELTTIESAYNDKHSYSGADKKAGAQI